MIAIKMPLRSGLHLKNIWLADKPVMSTALGFSVYFDCLSTRPLPGFVRVPKKALFIDLRQGTEAVFTAMNSDLRNRIRRSERAGLEFDFEASPDAFADIYDAFARSKEDFPPMHRGKLRLYWPHLMATRAVYHGETMGMHVHFVDPETRRATLVWASTLFREVSTSQKRNERARFNLHHFWHDIQLTAARGCHDYDFGYFGDTTKGLANVNKFKSQFPCVERDVSTYYSLPWWLWKRLLDRNTPL
jgi:hypothetical protein